MRKTDSMYEVDVHNVLLRRLLGQVGSTSPCIVADVRVESCPVLEVRGTLHGGTHEGSTDVQYYVYMYPLCFVYNMCLFNQPASQPASLRPTKSVLVMIMYGIRPMPVYALSPALIGPVSFLTTHYCLLDCRRRATWHGRAKKWSSQEESKKVRKWRVWKVDWPIGD
jgi:hypothetical protein